MVCQQRCLTFFYRLYAWEIIHTGAAHPSNPHFPTVPRGANKRGGGYCWLEMRVARHKGVVRFTSSVLAGYTRVYAQFTSGLHQGIHQGYTRVTSGYLSLPLRLAAAEVGRSLNALSVFPASSGLFITGTHAAMARGVWRVVLWLVSAWCMCGSHLMCGGARLCQKWGFKPDRHQNHIEPKKSPYRRRVDPAFLAREARKAGRKVVVKAQGLGGAL